MNAKQKIGRMLGGAMFSCLTFALVSCVVESHDEQDDSESVNQSRAAVTNPQFPNAFINSTIQGNYYVQPGTAATAVLTWKNPYHLNYIYGFDGRVTCLQVRVDSGPWGLVDCENTGNNVYTTKASWITSGHTFEFSLEPYNIPTGHAPSVATQQEGIVSLFINTH